MHAKASDYTVLRDLTDSRVAGVDLDAEWLRVGTGNENKNKHIKLEDYLSYVCLHTGQSDLMQRRNKTDEYV